jgi:protein gp37
VPAEFIRRVWETMEATPEHTYQILTKRPERMAALSNELPLLPNLWLGTSVENAEVLHRLDDLRATHAAVRFVSFEPLIGSVADADLTHINWAIVGGESGPRARPMQEVWAIEVRDRCHAAGTAFFFKQWGGMRPKSGGRRLQGREWSQYPRSQERESARPTASG